MPRYGAFLRGMNVGGYRITNEELRGVFAAMGLGEVQSFRASGNVVFTGDEEEPAALTARIEAELERSLGYAVPTLLRAEEEVRAIAAARPFPAGVVEASGGKLQVALLLARPDPGARAEMLALETEADRLALEGRELYWLPSGGITDSQLEMKTIERHLGPMTMRTKGTIELLAERHFSA
jgi:uncharacterized protein (DUF1697 family)